MTIIPLIFSPFLIVQFPASLSVCLLSPALPAYLNLSLGGAYPALLHPPLGSAKDSSGKLQESWARKRSLSYSYKAMVARVQNKKVLFYKILRNYHLNLKCLLAICPPYPCFPNPQLPSSLICYLIPYPAYLNLSLGGAYPASLLPFPPRLRQG